MTMAEKGEVRLAAEAQHACTDLPSSQTRRNGTIQSDCLTDAADDGGTGAPWGIKFQDDILDGQHQTRCRRLQAAIPACVFRGV